VADLERIRADLDAEHRALDELVRGLSEDEWNRDTPAEGWTVKDQIGHLAFFDEQATLAATDADGFARSLEVAAQDIDGFVNGPLERGRALPGGEVLEWWRRDRGAMHSAFAAVDPSARIPWYGPPMSPASFITARLMETWAHGQDIVDALRIQREPTERLRHVAFIGVRARRNSYAARGLEMPEGEVAVQLVGPGGETWSWNEGASDRIEGSALGFCLVVTQRRHPEDTDVVASGTLAQEWLSIAQAFAGPPGKGRRAGQFEKLT
jgi:uncharacterized protein (TIGR03084 family)